MHILPERSRAAPWRRQSSRGREEPSGLQSPEAGCALATEDYKGVYKERGDESVPDGAVYNCRMC